MRLDIEMYNVSVVPSMQVLKPASSTNRNVKQFLPAECTFFSMIGFTNDVSLEGTIGNKKDLIINCYSQILAFFLEEEELPAPGTSAGRGDGSISGAMDGGVPGTKPMNL